jgi:hypothetical protein
MIFEWAKVGVSLDPHMAVLVGPVSPFEWGEEPHWSPCAQIHSATLYSLTFKKKSPLMR